MKAKEEKSRSLKSESIIWFFKVFIITFILSTIFSYISTNGIDRLDIAPALIILVVVVLFGVIFDIIGVAVTCATEDEFHAMGTKRVRGAKTAIKLIRSAPKVSNICADVIGDICGVLSGAISAIITIKIMTMSNLSFDIQFLMSALVASFTVGGKALGKAFAKYNANKIIYAVSKLLSIFEK